MEELETLACHLFLLRNLETSQLFAGYVIAASCWRPFLKNICHADHLDCFMEGCCVLKKQTNKKKTLKKMVTKFPDLPHLTKISQFSMCDLGVFNACKNNTLFTSSFLDIYLHYGVPFHLGVRTC